MKTKQKGLTDEIAEIIDFGKAETMEQFLSKIDFKQLKGQKYDLLKIMDKVEKHQLKISQKQYNALEGILCLIDKVQDIAVDQYGYSERRVFNRGREPKKLS